MNPRFTPKELDALCRRQLALQRKLDVLDKEHRANARIIALDQDYLTRFMEIITEEQELERQQ